MDMPTTIAVKESTVQLLTRIKERMNAGSLDEAIVKVLQKVEKIPASRFGSQPQLKQFKETDRMKTHEL